MLGDLLAGVLLREGHEEQRAERDRDALDVAHLSDTDPGDRAREAALAITRRT